MTEPEASAGVLSSLRGALAGYMQATDRSGEDNALALLAAIVSSSDDAVISKTLDGTITSWNRAAEHLYGYSATEAIGQSITLIIPPERISEEADILARIRRGERVEHFETVRVARDGRRLQMSLTISPIFDREGRIVGASKVGRDITQRVQLETAARSTQEMLRLIVDNLPALISYIDRDYRYQWNNMTYERWFGSAYTKMAGSHVADVLGMAAWEKLRPYMDRALAGETVNYEDEIPYERAGKRWVHASYIPHFDSVGEVLGFAVLVNDIDARRRSEDAQRFLVGLHDATRTLQSPAEVLLEIVTQVGRHFGVIRCAYGEFDETLTHLRITRGYTDGVPSVAGVHPATRFGAGLLEWLKSGRTAVVQDIYADPRTADARPVYESMQLRSMVIAPIVKGDQLTALLVMGDRVPRAWTPHDASLLAQVAERTFFALSGARAQHALREQSEVMSLAMRAGRMGAWSQDLHTRAVWFSSELEAIFGLPAGGFAGSHAAFFELVHPDDRQALKDAVTQAVKCRTDYTVEFRYRHACGEWRWMEGRGQATFDADRPMVLYGLGIDIDERKRAEHVLRRQAAIFENQSDAIIVTDLDDRIIDCNPACERMLALSKTQLIGRRVQDFDRPDAGPMADRATRLRFERDGVWSGETEFIRSDGSFGSSETVVKRLVDGAGGVVGTVRVQRDISERLRNEAELRRLNQELSAADRRKDEFLAVLAHELRNPLAPIRNAAQFLRLKASSDPAQQNARDIIDRQIRHLVRLVDDLLDVSRISRGKINLQKEAVSLAVIVTNALESARPLIEERGHRLHVSLPEAPVVLDADLTRLAQVLQNLLNNAAKYTPDGGLIELIAEVSDDQVTIRVRDNGMGIPPEQLAHIFEMFMQVDRSIERSSGGLGIGLTLVERLVRLHGGRVSAHSAGVGHGSEFVVTLPRGRRTTSRPNNVEDVARSVAPLRILVADDNVDAADSLSLMLRAAGHQVHTEYDGEAAMNAVGQFEPDVVLLDIGMPRLNGYMAAREIRRLHPQRPLRLIAITGWGQQEDRRRSREAGFDHHLVKPVDPRTLEELLASKQAVG